MSNRTLITASGWIIAGGLAIALKRTTKENKAMLAFIQEHQAIIRIAQKIVVDRTFQEIMKSNGL